MKCLKSSTVAEVWDVVDGLIGSLNMTEERVLELKDNSI